MGNNYDEDDYSLDHIQDTYAIFDLDEDENDMYDFDTNDMRDQLEYEMSVLESFIVRAAIDGADADTIERMEDELELLTLDYHNLRT